MTALSTQHSALSEQPSPAKLQVSDAVLHSVQSDLHLALMNDYPPYSASILAERAGVGGNRESRRRIIRAAVDRLRAEPIGMRICANGLGYWAARDGREWEAYLESRKSKARFSFWQTRRITEAARDTANEQGRLF